MAARCQSSAEVRSSFRVSPYVRVHFWLLCGVLKELSYKFMWNIFTVVLVATRTQFSSSLFWRKFYKIYCCDFGGNYTTDVFLLKVRFNLSLLWKKGYLIWFSGSCNSVCHNFHSVVLLHNKKGHSWEGTVQLHHDWVVPSFFLCKLSFVQVVLSFIPRWILSSVLLFHNVWN